MSHIAQPLPGIDEGDEQYPRRHLPYVLECHGSESDPAQLEPLVHRLLDAYWDSPAGTLRFLNLRRGGTGPLVYQDASGARLDVAQPEWDVAPMPGSWALLAGRSLHSVTEVESPLTETATWLRGEARTFAPATVRRKAERALPECAGFAQVWASIAHEALERAVQWPKDWALGLVVAGIALSAELLAGTELQRRVAADRHLEARLRGLARITPLPATLQSLANVVASGRIAIRGDDIFDGLDTALEAIGRDNQALATHGNVHKNRAVSLQRPTSSRRKRKGPTGPEIVADFCQSRSQRFTYDHLAETLGIQSIHEVVARAIKKFPGKIQIYNYPGGQSKVGRPDLLEESAPPS